jgi:DNA primase large subunit
MVSVTGTTGKYILQPGLVSMHQQSLEWLSASALWKRELSFFQKLLDKNSAKATSTDLKKEMDHFQNIITYYDGEVVDSLRKRIREHESDLARMLQSLNESDTQYFKDHEKVMNELSTFSKTYDQFRHELFGFVEKIM